MASGQDLGGQTKTQVTHGPASGSPLPPTAPISYPERWWSQSKGWGLAGGWKGEPGERREVGPQNLGKKSGKEEG